MTKNELLNKVSSFYSGYLTTDKALKLFDIEYGYTPEITQNTLSVSDADIKALNLPEHVTPEALSFVKDLQESGVVNMFAATPNIQAGLLVERQEAKDILSAYMKHYTFLFHPEDML